MAVTVDEEVWVQSVSFVCQGSQLDIRERLQFKVGAKRCFLIFLQAEEEIFFCFLNDSI